MTRHQLLDLNFLGWLFCGAVFLILIHLGLTGNQARDFVYFYSIGHILNHYAPDRLYDFSLQAKIFSQILPSRQFAYGPSPYPPFVALVFRPFALLPFWTAYLMWLICSLALYLTGLIMLVRRFYPGDALRQSLLCCFGLSLWSFTLTLLAGQLSTVGFLSLAFAICFEDAGWPYLSGVALAICCYKPTLLVLILPMLLVTRRLKTLVGFLAAGVAIVSLTTLFEGAAIWERYLRFSTVFSRLSFVAAEHVDILSASRAITRWSTLGGWCILLAGMAAAVQLVRVWWLASRTSCSLPAQLLWGATITWTLVLNVYVPFYDTILLVPAIILTAKAFTANRDWQFVSLCVAAVLSSYFARAIAEASGIQIFTALLAAFGTLQLRLCARELSDQLPSGRPPVLANHMPLGA